MFLFILLVGLGTVLLFKILKWKNSKIIWNRNVLQDEKFVLVTAHPDDECMFFGPTLVHLISKFGKNSVFVLCLSQGEELVNGKRIRKEELVESCKVLGLNPNHIFSLNKSKFKDAQTAIWSSSAVLREIRNFIAKIQQREQVSHFNIITFDNRGVSGHSCHISVYNGARLIQKAPLGISLYTLKSQPIYTKYFVPAALLQAIPKSAGNLVLVSLNPKSLREAMSKHKSQMKWFRRIWMYVSSYVYLNTLQEISLKRT